jgi:hypothetical protein
MRSKGILVKPDKFHEFIQDQIKEIELQKWLASERAGQDLGNEFCIYWCDHFAKDFKIKWLKSHKR